MRELKATRTPPGKDPAASMASTSKNPPPILTTPVNAQAENQTRQVGKYVMQKPVETPNNTSPRMPRVKERFCKDAVVRFGPPMHYNTEVLINKLYQIGSVASYTSHFELLSTRTPSLTVDNLLNRFVAGLKEEVHREIVLLHPVNLHMIMGMACVAEQKIAFVRGWKLRGGPPWYPPNQPKQGLPI
ncbi:hypothetical protein QQ045_010525 [Rhodiola kirilowii]